MRKKNSNKKLIEHKDYLFNHWTNTALDCYERHCICEGCQLEDICERQPKDNPYSIVPMKFVIIKLLENLGKPTEEMLNNRNYEIVEDPAELLNDLLDFDSKNKI